MEGLEQYEKVERPWGSFERLSANERTTVKIIHISAGEALSLQTHEERDEFWRVLKGFGTVHIEGRDTDTREDDSFFIPRYAEHRAVAGPEGLVILEIAFGTFDEKDEKRLADEYGRT